MGNRLLVRRVDARLAGAREVRDVDAARDRMDVGMQVSFGLVQAVPAGQHQIGVPHQRAFRRHQPVRGAQESRQFVHAVVDNRGRRQVVGEGPRHRGVVPEHVLLEAVRGDQAVDQGALRRDRIRGRVRPQVRDDDEDAAFVARDFEIGDLSVELRLLDEEHTMRARTT